MDYKDKMLPLSTEEKADAEKHHNLIYSALNKYGYVDKTEELYDIAALAFLKAIQSYHRMAGLSDRCALSTVCYSNIRRDIAHHYRSMSTIKRKPQQPLVYLDDEGECETALHNAIGSGYNIEEETLDNIEYSDIFAKFSEQQRTIAKMRIEGYHQQEIRKELKISRSVYAEELTVIKEIIKG